MLIKINDEKFYQTISGFGVSGAWWAQTVGGWTGIDEKSGLEKRERIAQLLFDDEKGIGISCYRYNLGSGSKNSGKGRYRLESRRAESFDISDTEYDWSRDKNAVWMLKEAVKNGVDEIVLFVNSPPERMTKNGLGYQSYAGQTNLQRKNYKRFVKYTLDVAEHFINDGIPVKYISPVNEPVWFWTEKQEGCHYRPWQVKNVMCAFVDEMNKRPAFKDVMISGAENGDIRWFNKTYCRIMLGNKKIKSKVDSIDTHSYFTHLPIPIIEKKVNDRIAFMKRYRKFVDRHYPNMQIKTSEWTHMKNKRDYGMDSALEQAKIMFEDLTILNVTSWQNWIALSDTDYCDGLIYEFDDTQNFELTKRYFAFGNFSKFVKKGSVRIDALSDDKDLKIVAFKNGNNTLLIVINPTEYEKEITLSNEKSCGKMFVTSDSDDLAEYDVTLNNIKLQKRSVNTICF